MDRHTPGPWEIDRHEDREDGGGEDWFRISGGSTLHLEVRACADGYVPNQNEANARLIAAAPEILECLRALVEAVGRIPAETAARMELVMPHAHARAAIAKATAR